MLLLHQAGAVKVGEVVRYQLTYTPSVDRILPTPSHLHIRIKNTSAIPLRAAYLHGPYTLHVSAHPSVFSPYEKLEDPVRFGEPEFEPYLKAGGHWQAKLVVPEDIRERGDKPQNGNNDETPKTASWIIEISSQILFSNTASVDFELLAARDARSLDVGFAAVAGKGYGEPGTVEDFTQHGHDLGEKRSTQPKGVYSRAIHLKVEDTATLWSQPPLPQWTENNPHNPSIGENLEVNERKEGKTGKDPAKQATQEKRKQKRLHLVILTHGLHSNLGADMLYLKESIDAASKKAREDAKLRQRTRPKPSQGRSSTQEREISDKQSTEESADLPKESSSSTEETETQADIDYDDANDEEVIVRGFPGNAVKTEKGIQYLGKRLAKYILTVTYPDQPYLPPSKSTARSFTNSFSSKSNQQSSNSDQQSSKFHKQPRQLPYTFTKISFVGHSLGGLTQTYAMAWIQKHSPDFFKKIKPENFIALASPLLGLSNENPLYVKFALDFGLVGRTGRDLGLSWRAPNFARSGWSAMMGGFGGNNNAKEGESNTDPAMKPLLRILPTGPAHQVLKLFRNRTVYSNVVNDGIVPLRTSCLLFLDWRGLDRVENAQRGNGLIATMASFGWNELTGANTVSHRPISSKSGNGSSPYASEEDLEMSPNASRRPTESTIPIDASADIPVTPLEPEPHQFIAQHHLSTSTSRSDGGGTTFYHDEDKNPLSGAKSSSSTSNPFSDFFNFFKPASPKPQAQEQRRRKVSKKTTEKFHRAQTVMSSDSQSSVSTTEQSQQSDPKEYMKRPAATRGDSLNNDANRVPPPKTSVLVAAGDILNPPIPSREWILDPTNRQRTIFHDRIYHPDDIPPPAPRKPRLGRSFSNGSLRSNASSTSKEAAVDVSGIRVEEKIARAYHKDLSWRKVLVRLEPDAHNNMIVRRMFANAYGWEVVKHLCDTHFSDSYSATTRDAEEVPGERAKDLDQPVGKEGEESRGQTKHEAPDQAPNRTTSELREASDEVKDLGLPKNAARNMSSSSRSNLRRFSKDNESTTDSWNEEVFEGSDGEGSDEDAVGPFEMFQRFWNASPKEGRRHSDQHSHHHSPKHSRQDIRRNLEETEENDPRSTQAEIAEFLTQSPTSARSKPFDREVSRSQRRETNEQAAIDADVVSPSQVAGDKTQDPDMTQDRGPNASGIGSLGLSELGLQRPIAEQVSSPASPNAPRTPGSLTEQVARLSTEGQEEQQ